MTQITKTLSIVSIIAMVTAPAMAEIASTQYVQSALSGITSALDAKLSNNATGTNAIAIGTGANATAESAIQLGKGTNTEPASLSVGLYSDDGEGGIDGGNYKLLDLDGFIPFERFSDETCDMILEKTGLVDEDGYISMWRVDLGGLEEKLDNGLSNLASGELAIAIGFDPDTGATGDQSLAIGMNSHATARMAIQLGQGTNNVPATFNVGFGLESAIVPENNYRLLNANGTIPAGRLTAPNFDDDDGYYISDNNGTRGQLLQTNGDGTMSWVNVTDSVLPALPAACKTNGQKCSLITTWSSSTNKPTYSWEVIRDNQ